MTKKELIINLLHNETHLGEEMLVSIEDHVRWININSDPDDSLPIHVGIDYVAGQFINVTIV